MDEERLLDYVLLDLKSVDGKISVDSFVAMQQVQSLQDQRVTMLQKVHEDGHIGCSTDTVSIESEIWLTEKGLEFLSKGGYRKRKKSSFEKEDKKPKQKLLQVLLYLIPLALLVALILVLFEVI